MLRRSFMLVMGTAIALVGLAVVRVGSVAAQDGSSGSDHKSGWWDYAIGAAVVAVLLGSIWALTGKGGIINIVVGADGRASTSKLQWALWTGVVLFSYAALYSARAREGDYSVISDIPSNVLLALGLSATTMVVAKGITVNYVSNGRIAKPPDGKVGKVKGWAAIFEDDDGVPDLSKIQIVGWTIIALGAYLLNVGHQINELHKTAGTLSEFPDIDGALMVLMGLSQGSYLGKKLVTTDPNSEVTITTGSTLAPAVVNQPYNQPLQATGGMLPYVWAFVGTLPAGLSLTDSKIEGTPTTAGTNTFNLQVKDASDQSPLEQSFTIVIT